MEKIIISEENINLFSNLMEMKLELGDTIFKYTESAETKHIWTPAIQDSHLTPEMFLELDEQYGDTLRDLVDG